MMRRCEIKIEIKIPYKGAREFVRSNLLTKMSRELTSIKRKDVIRKKKIYERAE